MAFVTGQASNYADLYAKLIDFLLNDPALVSAGQRWQRVWQSPTGDADGVVLAGPGLAGLDAIYVGLDLTGDKAEDRTAGNYWMTVRGMTGVLPSATDLLGHANVQPFRTRTFLDAGPMQYWFVANGRRFIVVVKISTVFESMYAGLFLPYATPLQYPYPLAIGGTSGGKLHTDSDSWRSREDSHAAFPFSFSGSTVVSDAAFSASLGVLSPAGEWVAVRGQEGGLELGAVLHPCATPRSLFTYMAGDDGNFPTSGYYKITPQELKATLGAVLGRSELALQDLTIVRNAPSEAIYGVLDGCYSVAGDGNSAENIVTAGGVDHLTVQNAYRTTLYNYFAIALE